MLPTYVNELAAFTAPVLLVLDDYHAITAQPVHAIVDLLIEHAPSNLHLVISSRGDPALSLARLRGRGRLAELHHQDLCFDAGEAHAFLADVMGLPLGVRQSAALHERTEGWIAGLQMAAVYLHGRSNQADIEALVAAFAGNNRQIMDCLLAEVYQHQPAEVCSFLLRTRWMSIFGAVVLLLAMLWTPAIAQTAETP